MTPPVIRLYGARHVKQLQVPSPSKSTNCGPCALLMALQVGARMSVPFDQQDTWLRDLRRLMGKPIGATTLLDHERAAESERVGGAYLGAGRRDPSMLVVTATHDLVAERLRDGHPMVLLIDYGRLNDLMPALSGSPTYRGLHFVCLAGFDSGWTRLGDPLHDGRRAGIPKGWQTVRVMRYLRAAETAGTPAAGKGHAKVGILMGGGAL